MNKRGMTLMELLVYMAIVGIVVVVAGTAFTNSTKMRIRTEGKLSASQLAEDVGTLIKDDVGQMGAKGAKYSKDVGSDSFYVENRVLIDPANNDLSSFVYQKGADVSVEMGGVNTAHRNDSLFMKRIRYSESGQYEAVEEVSWFVENGQLIRTCESVDAVTEQASCPSEEASRVTIAENVKFFELTPATPGILSSDVDVVLYPSGGNKNLFRLISRYDGTKYFRLNLTPPEGGNNILLNGFVSNFDTENEEYTSEKKVNEVYAAEQGGDEGTWSDLCTHVTLEKDVAYRLSFMISRSSEKDKSQMFVPGKDHMSVGFRTADGEKTSVRDFSFYPPMASEAGTVERVMQFSPSEKLSNVCIAFDFAAYSPLLATGSMNMSGLKLQKDPEASYTFVSGYNPLTGDKSRVRAFQVSLAVEKNKEIGRVKLVVPVPSNGIN